MFTETSKGLDYFYMLKRRRLSFEKWCQSVGIRTVKDFFEVKQTIEAQGEFFFPKEMVDLGFALPQDPNYILAQGKKPLASPLQSSKKAKKSVSAPTPK